MKPKFSKDYFFSVFSTESGLEPVPLVDLQLISAVPHSKVDALKFGCALKDFSCLDFSLPASASGLEGL